ncbi:MAG: AmmeMemoRadiSam system protein B [Deltaproteobacteria bacterium]|nr:AmmeMemoRadiSam system protein B [Deltaproteobacteria bacterium]
MSESAPRLRHDLQFFPVQHGGQQLILIQDHFGLVQEGKAVPIPLYQLMILLDGTKTIRDLQMDFMRRQGGVLVSSEEIARIMRNLDESYLLESERFNKAKERIIGDFTSQKVRPCSHAGRGYPEKPEELERRIEGILNSEPNVPAPDGNVAALIAPHIDLNVGYKVYSKAYRMLRGAHPSRIILLGVGHQMTGGFFSLTQKDFETPFGTVENDIAVTNRLYEAGGDIIADNDYSHRSEHSIEFQLLFLQHLFQGHFFRIVPILCGFDRSELSEYSRSAFLEKTAPFLDVIKACLSDEGHETLLIAGVDFSHTGPKFGHEMPATHMEPQSQAHDRELLGHLCRLDADQYWEASRRVEDRYNVCGFSAMACLLEVLPPCKGELLDYQIWHEEPTRSAVSFAAVRFVKGLE